MLTELPFAKALRLHHEALSAFSALTSLEYTFWVHNPRIVKCSFLSKKTDNWITVSEWKRVAATPVRVRALAPIVRVQRTSE